MLVNLHIIGVQKAGTTALARFLEQHPEICLVDGKEAHIFDHPNFKQRPNPAAFAKRQYANKLGHYQNQAVICDATPITVYHEQFLEACYQYNTNAKFIVMLRDPVERAISQYHMSRDNGHEHHCMLLAFLLEHWRLRQPSATASWPFTSPYRTHSYLHRGLYTQQLERLYRVVPRKQTIVLMQSELKHTHQQTMNKIMDFIGIQKIPIQAKSVFKTEQKYHHWSDKFAIACARIYFKLKGETPANWHKIIHS